MVTRVKVLSVIKPPDKNYWSCYIVTFLLEGHTEPIVSYKDRDEYKRFTLEQKLLKQGVDGKLLEEYKEACNAVCERNHAEEAAGVDL